MYQKLTTVVGLVAILAIASSFAAKCPAPGPVPRHFLDASYFADWYVLKAGSNYDDNIPFTSCLKWSFSYDPVVDPNIMNVTQTGAVNGSSFADTGVATVRFSLVPSHFEVYISHTYFPTDVVATDVTQYAIQWMCKDNEGREDAQFSFQVLSRTKTLNPLLMADIVAYIEGQGMRPDQLFDIDQTNCP